jgi:uncharacterized protein (TIGR03437 family)
VFTLVLCGGRCARSAEPDYVAHQSRRYRGFAGHTPPRARPEFDRGAVAGSFALPAITLHLKRSDAQQASLDQLLAGRQDPASPNYHKWLTPEQYAGRFGVSSTDIDQIKAWLESEGLSVKAVARSRTWLTFSGTAVQVNTAFKTRIDRFDVNGASHFANAIDPSIPAALAGIPPNGSVSSKNLGFATLPAPKTVVFEFGGVDASGRTWSQQFSVPFTGVQTALAVAGASNAASGDQSYAPGMIVSLYGTGLGDFAQSAATLPLPGFLAGFEALVNGVPAPLYYVSPNQVNLQIPYETSPGPVTVDVYNPYADITYNIRVTAAAPGIFSAGGFISPPFASARAGQPSTLFLTGEGTVRPSLATGSSPSPGTLPSRLPRAILPVTLTVGGESASILFNGIPSGLVGVTQINFTVPADLAPGVYPVVVTVGGVASPPVNLTVAQ